MKTYKAIANKLASLRSLITIVSYSPNHHSLVDRIISGGTCFCASEGCGRAGARPSRGAYIGILFQLLVVVFFLSLPFSTSAITDLSTRSFSNKPEVGSHPNTLTSGDNQIRVDITALTNANIYRAILNPNNLANWSWSIDARTVQMELESVTGNTLELCAPRYVTFDATEAVQTAITAGQTQLVINVITAAGLGVGDTTIRLDVMCDLPAVTPISQASEINAVHRNGDTMIVFKEYDSPITTNELSGNEFIAVQNSLEAGPCVRYRIYRSTTPITALDDIISASLIDEIGELTCWNSKYYGKGNLDTDDLIPRYPIDDLVVADPETGIYVHRFQSETPETAYYYVSRTIDGAEDFSNIEQGGNATLGVTEGTGRGRVIKYEELEGQYYAFKYNITVHRYVRWECPPTHHMPSEPYNYFVALPPPESQVDHPPACLSLHPWGDSVHWGASYWYGWENSTLFITMNQYPYDWYTAYHEHKDTLKSWRTGTVQPFTQARILSFMFDFAIDAYNINTNQLILSGVSMGGSGTSMWGLRSGHIFSELISSVGSHIPAETYTFRLSYEDCYGTIDEAYPYSNEILERFGYSVIRSEDNISAWDYWDNDQWLRAHPEAETPHMNYANGMNDGVIDWDQAWKHTHAMIDTKRPFIFNWGQIAHSQRACSKPLYSDSASSIYRLHQAVPAFQHCSLDHDIGTDSSSDAELAGLINRYLTWNVNSMVDQPDVFQIDLRLIDTAPSESCTVDMTPRKLQAFDVSPFYVYTWTNYRISDMSVLQSGTVIADAITLLTIPNLLIERSASGNRVVIQPSGEKQLLKPIGSQVAKINEELAFQLEPNDTNDTGVTCTATGLPPGATLDSQTGQFRWTPAPDMIGVYSVTFFMTDGIHTNSETVLLYVDGASPCVDVTYPSPLETEIPFPVIQGIATDDVEVASIHYLLEYDMGGSSEGMISLNGTIWQLDDVYVREGNNALTLTVYDIVGNSATQCVLLIRHIPEPTMVYVSTVQELQQAVNQLENNTTIVIAEGVYELTERLYIGDPWEPDAESLYNITVRGAGASRDDVVLKGPGMTVKEVPKNIFSVFHAADVTIENLTVRDVYWHLVHFHGEQGALAPTLRNVHLINSGDHIVKGSYTSSMGGVDYGLMEDCLLEYETCAADYYCGGIDIHMGKNWVIRGNTFRNIYYPPRLTDAAILMWNYCSDTLTENNYIYNCDRGIYYGLESKNDADDHVGGIIRNNIIYRERSGDAGISLNMTRNVKVYHNTVYQSGTYPWSIEYRFASINGDNVADIRYNITDGSVEARDGATATIVGNLTGVTSSIFEDVALQNLHLASTATAAIDQALPLDDVVEDVDHDWRPIGSAPDIGADEYREKSVLISSVAQEEGSTMVKIEYDLINEISMPVDVELYVSANAGASWDLVMNDSYLYGNIGNSVSPGTRLFAFWDTSAALQNAYGYYSVCLVADGMCRDTSPLFLIDNLGLSNELVQLNLAVAETNQPAIAACFTNLITIYESGNIFAQTTILEHTRLASLDDLISLAEGVCNDTDGDGLCDIYEFVLGSFYNDSDSDDDDLSDGDEVNIYFTNPVSLDTDGDTFSDNDELFYVHSDPLDPDDPMRENIALASHGTTVTLVGDGVASYLHDGITDNPDEYTYDYIERPMTLDFQDVYLIDYLCVHMGTASPYYTIRASVDGVDWETLLTFVSTNNQVATHALADPIPARYVQITGHYCNGMDKIRLREFEVFRIVDALDSDHDGLTDQFEYDHGISYTNPDSDNDGCGDGQEYLAGTDPNDDASRFEMNALERQPVSEDGFVIQWQSITGKLYTVSRSSDLMGGFTEIASDIVGQIGMTCYTDQTVTATSMNIYRVDVQP